MAPFEQGFIEKCAELGVDPEELAKLAAKMSTDRIPYSPPKEHPEITTCHDRYGSDGITGGAS